MLPLIGFILWFVLPLVFLYRTVNRAAWLREEMIPAARAEEREKRELYRRPKVAKFSGKRTDYIANHVNPDYVSEHNSRTTSC